ncbi:MAG: amidase domain-containing protein [bacterium]
MKRKQGWPVLIWTILLMWLWLSFLPCSGTLAASNPQVDAGDRALIASLAQRYLQAGVEVMQTGDLAPLSHFLSVDERERLAGRFLGPSGLCWLWNYYQEDAAAGWKGEPILVQSFSSPVILVQGEEAVCYLNEEIRVSAPGLVSGQLCWSSAAMAHTILLQRTVDSWAISGDLAWEENVKPASGMQIGSSSPYPRVAGFPAYEEVVALFPQQAAPVFGRPATPSRGAVVAYSDLYALNPNTPYYPDFSASGGDCANFISQALYEGGWAMDTSSSPELQWWFHWPGAWSEPIHCSDSWVYAGDYAEGGGLGYTVKNNPPGSTAPNGACPGRADDHWGELKLGDLALVHTQEDPDTHHLGVVAAFDQDHGAPAPFPLVNAHSSNRYHYPLDWNGAYSLQQIDVLLLRYPSPSPLTLTATPAVLAFEEEAGSVPQDWKSLQLGEAGGGALSWSATANVPWLTVVPTTGNLNSTPTLVYLQADARALSAGNYFATLSISSPQAGNSPLLVSVQLRVRSAGGVKLLFQPGWNQISLPLTTPSSPAQVFVGLPEPWFLYRWDPMAARYDAGNLISLRPGEGYWLKAALDGQPLWWTVTGSPCVEEEQTIDIVPGWEMIGDPYLTAVPAKAVQVRTASLTLTLEEAVAEQILAPAFYWYDSLTYRLLSLNNGFLEPGQGYWLKAFQPFQMVFHRPL